jgi:hypothetical protein
MNSSAANINTKNRRPAKHMGDKHMGEMSNWKVIYRDHFDQNRSSLANPSKEAALLEARNLYRSHRAQIYRLEGPDGETVPNGDVMSWVYANKW